MDSGGAIIAHCGHGDRPRLLVCSLRRALAECGMGQTPPISAVVTSFNSAITLEACLRSLAFCDEVLVLDSGSTDGSRELAASLGARVHEQPFLGYAAQKQSAVDRAAHDWVLLLDSDEWLGDEAPSLVRAAVAANGPCAYRLPRREWLFWQWQHPRSRHNTFVRLFDRRHARLSRHAVHETVVAEGRVGALPVMIWHRGDPDISSKTTKANRYSSLQQEDLQRRRVRWLGVRLLVYPSLAFLRYYLLRGHWRSGWAGFIAARVHAFYAFSKYAKHLEQRRQG